MKYESSETPSDGVLGAATTALRDRAIRAGPPDEAVDLVLELRPAAVWRYTRAVAAAAILLGVGLAGWLIVQRSATVAFAEVIQKIAQTHTFTATLQAGDEPPIRLMVKNAVMRIELADGVELWNHQSGNLLTLHPARHEADTMQLAEQKFDLYGVVRDYRGEQETPLGEKTIAGQVVRGFEVTRSGLIAGGPRQTWTFWVDPKTGLPIQVEIREAGQKESAILTDLHFDVPLDDALFDMTIPAGYRVSDIGGIATSQLSAPPTTREAQAMTVTPLVGIGSVHFYASAEQIIAAFGKPEKIQGKNIGLEYYSKGFGILVHGPDGMVGITCFGPATARFFAANAFAGKTDKGIAMNAGRADIEAAYGKADHVTQAGDQTVLEYKKLRVTFRLIGDHLNTMLLMAPPPPGASR